MPRVVRPGLEPRQLAFRGHAVSHTGHDFTGGEHVPSPGGAPREARRGSGMTSRTEPGSRRGL